MSTAAVLAAVALAALAAGFTGGWKVQGWRWGAADAARLEAQAEAQRLQARVADEAAARHEAEKAAIAAQRRTITKEVVKLTERESMQAQCLDAAALELVRQAASPEPAKP
jgi:hypothetical protein